MSISPSPLATAAAPLRASRRGGAPRFAAIAVLALLIAVACVEEPTVPRLGDQIIQVSVASSKTQLRAGEVDTLTVTVRNTLGEPVQLVFPTLCTVRVFIRNAQGKVQVPAGGVHDCPAIQSLLVIPANGQVTQEFYWAGGSALDGSPPATRLPAGNYYASVRLDAEGYSTVGFPVLITVID
jgi:hypothetical protein